MMTRVGRISVRSLATRLWTAGGNGTGLDVRPSRLAGIHTNPVSRALGELGALREMPQLVPRDEFLATAKKRAMKTEYKPDLQGARQKERKRTVEALHMFSQSIAQPLEEIVATYRRRLKRLHPFEKVVAESIIFAQERQGKGSAKELLAILADLRVQTVLKIRAACVTAKNAENSAHAREILAQTMDEVIALWDSHSHQYDSMRALGKRLRAAPVVDPKIPMFVLCGVPNVGKSSIVRALSTGKPEVQNYPFTTRSTSLGHIVEPALGFPVCQVMDTPGLLARDQPDFNAMERMTLAALQHVPSAAGIVLDLSGLAGDKSSVAAQLQVLRFLHKEFPDRHWTHIITKSDLPRVPLSEEEAALIPDDALSVSSVTGEGMESLKNAITLAVQWQGAIPKG
jgi:nucleolar GTP-binding protein